MLRRTQSALPNRSEEVKLDSASTFRRHLQRKSDQGSSGAAKELHAARDGGDAMMLGGASKGLGAKSVMP